MFVPLSRSKPLTVGKPPHIPGQTPPRPDGRATPRETQPLHGRDMGIYDIRLRAAAGWICCSRPFHTATRDGAHSPPPPRALAQSLSVCGRSGPIVRPVRRRAGRAAPIPVTPTLWPRTAAEMRVKGRCLPKLEITSASNDRVTGGPPSDTWSTSRFLGFPEIRRAVPCPHRSMSGFGLLPVAGAFRRARPC